jgi:hypothetical protein
MSRWFVGVLFALAFSCNGSDDDDKKGGDEGTGGVSSKGEGTGGSTSGVGTGGAASEEGVGGSAGTSNDGGAESTIVEPVICKKTSPTSDFVCGDIGSCPATTSTIGPSSPFMCPVTGLCYPGWGAARVACGGQPQSYCDCMCGTRSSAGPTSLCTFSQQLECTENVSVDNPYGICTCCSVACGSSLNVCSAQGNIHSS